MTKRQSINQHLAEWLGSVDPGFDPFTDRVQWADVVLRFTQDRALGLGLHASYALGTDHAAIRAAGAASQAATLEAIAKATGWRLLHVIEG